MSTFPHVVGQPSRRDSAEAAEAGRAHKPTQLPFEFLLYKATDAFRISTLTTALSLFYNLKLPVHGLFSLPN